MRERHHLEAEFLATDLEEVLKAVVLDERDEGEERVFCWNPSVQKGGGDVRESAVVPKLSIKVRECLLEQGQYTFRAQG